MSFGFGVSDFIAIIELANKIRKEFVNAPSQFKDISDEVRSLSIVLRDVEVVLSVRELHNEQKAELNEIANGCRNVLNELEHTLSEYDELKSGSGSASTRAKRVWKRLKWEPEDIKQLRSRIGTNVGLLNGFTGRLTLSNVVTLMQKQEDQSRHTILQWITTIDYAPQQSDFISRRQAGTGQWLLDSAEFNAWRQTSKQILFCPGIPGAGKSILTSIVVEEINARFENDGSVGIAYLYCDFRRQHEQKLTDLFASLLKQLLQEQPFLPDSVKTLYLRHKNKRTRPSFDEISEVLQSVMAEYSRVFIIIDALDECQISDGCRQRFLLGLFNLHAKCGANLFVTSRPIFSIEKKFEGNTSLEIRASDEDVRRYLEGCMFRLPGFVTRSLELQEEIKTSIVKAVDGMFLLAQLHLDSLTGKRAPKAIRTALKNLATGSEAYDYAYEDAMQRITCQSKDQEELAKQVLWWITCAKRPLSTSELQCALAVEIGESLFDKDNLPQVEDIISVCAGLVTVDKESSIIRLVHYTAQEYFDRTQGKWFPNVETDIATICATYLSFNDFESGICQNDEQFELRLETNQLYDYAAHHWGHHARAAPTSCHSVLEFLKKQAQVEASSQALIAVKKWSGHKRYSQETPKQMTGLHLAAYFGIYDTVRELLSTNDPDPNDSFGQTPLSWAAVRGHEAIVKLLLETNMVNIDSKDSKYSRTPLLWAAESGHEAVVKLLLETNKVNIDSKDSRYGRTPLLWAVINGHEDVIKLLLNEGADFEAAEYGHEAVIRLLLETNKGRVDSKSSRYGRTPLLWAVMNGLEAIIKLLLDKGANFEAKDEDWGRTPLSWAAENRHEAVIKLLIDKGAELEAKDKHWGLTPLLWAAKKGYDTVIRLLLDQGAEPEAKDKEGRTALSHAAPAGHQAVVKLLLDTDKVDIDSKAKNGRTPLSRASENGREAIVQLLLNTGKVDVDSKDTYGQTPLSYAAQNGHKAIVQLLLETAKVKPDSKDNQGWTPLSRAAVSGHEAVVRLLLESPGNVNIDWKDPSGFTPLMRAASKGHVAVVRLLLDADKVDLNLKDSSGGKVPPVISFSHH